MTKVQKKILSLLHNIERNSRKWIAIAGLIVLIVCISRFLSLANKYLTVTPKALENTSQLSEILEGDEYTQIIHCDENGLDTIKIYFSTFGRKNHCSINIKLSDEEKEIQTWKLDGKLLSDNKYFTLKLDRKLKNSKGRDYRLRVTSDAKAGEGVTIYTNNDEGPSGLIYNRGETDRTLCYQVIYKRPLSELWDYKANAFHINIVFFIAVALLLALPIISTLSVEKLVLAVWIPTCCLYLFSSTIFNVPDEEGHFYRAFEISSGHLVSELNAAGDSGGRFLPMVDVNLGKLEKDWQSFWENKDMTLSDDLRFVGFSNMSLYSPLCYVPQATGMLVARTFSRKVAVVAYAGRIASLIAITLLIFFTLKLLPTKAKAIMGLIFLIPMNIHEAVSLAPDGFVTAQVAFMVAYVIHISFMQEAPIKKSQIFVLYLMAIAISQMKIAYLPAILVYFLIPSEKLGGAKHKAFHAVLVALISASLSLIWLRVAKQFLLHVGANSEMQVHNILMHPLTYAAVMVRTFVHSAKNWILTMIGSRLNELNVTTSRSLAWLYVWILVFSCYKNWNYKDWSIKKNGVFSLIVASTIVLIMTSLYVQWTPVANDIIIGIQGRYFLPLLLPLYFSVCPIDLTESEDSIGCYQLFIVTGINICACISILFASLAISSV